MSKQNGLSLLEILLSLLLFQWCIFSLWPGVKDLLSSHQCKNDLFELQSLVNGDYDTPEQQIGKFQTGWAWESCMTMTKCEGGGWSYRPDGKTIPYKEVVQTLVQTVTGDGNLLLNVGPLPTGEFPADQVVILKKVGKMVYQFYEISSISNKILLKILVYQVSENYLYKCHIG